MATALSVLHTSLAVAGVSVSFVRGADVQSKQLKTRTRDFADTVANDVLACLQSDNDLKVETDKVLTSDSDDASKIRDLTPLVAKAARSMLAVAGSGEHAFDQIFTPGILAGVAKNIVVRLR